MTTDSLVLHDRSMRQQQAGIPSLNSDEPTARAVQRVMATGEN
jgi:hypothetical protein